MKPTIKDQAIEQFLARFSGNDRRETIRVNMCQRPPIGCGLNANEFKDDLSKREYRISGLCQVCQDAFFGSAEKDDPQCLKGTGVTCNCFECEGLRGL